jgi:integrase
MPNKINLTQLAADRLRPAATDIIFWDRALPGFGLRVSSKGTKTFLAQYRVRQEDGSFKERQETLGRLSYMSVGQARDAARAAKLKAASGVDPVSQKRAAKAAAEVERVAAEFTLAKLVDRYTAEHMTHLKPGGRLTKHYLLARWTRQYGDRRADSITEADVLKFKNDLLKGRSDGRAQTDHLILALRRVYKWGLARKLVTHNPATGIARDHHHTPRDRVLDDDEIKRFWAACDQIGWPAAPIFKLLLLTGQREMEIGGLRWTEINLGTRQINLPASRTKNGKAHTVHLSDLALEIIEAQPKIVGCDYVFSTTGQGPFRRYTDNRRSIQRLMGEGTPDFVTHDLRRTATTIMARLKVPPHVADKVLNHVNGAISGVAAVYNRFEYLDERRDALDALGRFVATLIGRDSGNVVPLVAAAG